MGEECSTYGRDRKINKNVWFENLSIRDNFKDLEVDRRHILEWILEK
jgi:uncharacterized protein YkvS